jgi:hypothetical protein
MCVVTVPLGIPARLSCAIAVGCLLGGRGALAFPLTDPSNPSIVTNVPEPTDSDLRNQLQQHSGFGAAAAGGGWTFVPSISWEEIFTDNVFDTERNRRWDILTTATPSIAITGDVPNAQVQFQYGPQFLLAARTPQENRITNQLSGTGLFTIVPDEFYIDTRAIAGAAPVGAGYGALSPGVTPNFGGFGTLPGGLSTTGLASQNQVQTNSYSIAPYWLHEFGDVGTAKIGYQFGYSSYAQTNSYVPLFFTTGNNAADNITNEGVAQFQTGDRFAPFRNLVLLDAQVGNGTFQGNSHNYTAVNRLGYLVNHDITVYGEIGYEDIEYNGTPRTQINDAIWGVGTTWTPNPDSQITVTFGHQYGDNNVGFSGYYALSARTRISASYTTGLQTDLQGIQSQLDLTSLDSTGQTVNSQTGAPMFIGTGGLGVQSGLYRIKAFTASASTVLDRDQFSVWLEVSQTTTIAQAPANARIPFNISAPPVGSTNQATTVFATWTHQVSDDLTLNGVASYSTSNLTNGGGNQRSGAVSIGAQYLISQTLAATASYSFYDVIGSNRARLNPSGIGQSYYQNLVIVGLTKQF